MKGDFTRSTFKPEKHYSSVRMQQGRLQLDADWNEQVDILAHLNKAQIKDLIGHSGVPNSEENAQSFKISSISGEKDFTITRGRIYVDGILCELEKDTKYTEQPDYPNALQEDLGQEELKEGDYIAYLDVWQRHITSVDDPQIREVALENVPDTATRTKTVWQVKLLQVREGDDAEETDDAKKKAEETAKKTWKQFLEKQHECNISLTPKVFPNANLDNHLYRVEIHEGGKAEDATFKWSRDNGFVVSAIQKINHNIITIRQNNNNDDAWQLARPGQWIEILRNDKKENWELSGKPGILVRLQRVLGNNLILDLSSIHSKRNLPEQFSAQENQEEQYKVRLWDYTIDTGEKAGIPVSFAKNPNFIRLQGEGIAVKFEVKDNYNYQTGYYWLIPTRRISQNILEWPKNPKDKDSYSSLPPNRIEHHHSRLALINFSNQTVTDYRKPFPSLINCLDHTNGKVDISEITNSDASLKVDGIVSAEQFKGDGSKLTSITAEQVGAVSTKGGKIEGDIFYQGTLWQSSSRTLMNDISELSIEEADQIVMGLNPIKFNYNNSPHIGFISEEVPDLVASSDKKDICPVDILAVLTKTVQDQQQSINQLNDLLDEQNQEIEKLHDDLRRLKRRPRIISWLRRLAICSYLRRLFSQRS